MKFSVTNNQLFDAVNKVIGVVPSRSTLPILGNILLDLKGDELTLTGSDLDVYVESRINVSAKSDGQITIPAKKLESLLQNLGEKEINLELQPNFRFVIKTKGGRWTITGENPADYPMPSEFEPVNKISINHELLTRYLTKAVHAASQDELRRGMNGVFFEVNNNELRIVSTDGHRLVKIVRKGFQYEGDRLTMLVPIKTCNLINRLMKTKASDKSGTEAEEIDIFFSRELIKVTYGNTTIVSKLIDDSFPNYESVIPTDNEKILKINRADLLDSLKRSIVMSDPITNKITFTIISDELKISASNTEYGTDADETIKCSFTEKEDFEIAFNGRYLIEALQSYETDEVLFDINSPLKAVIIRPSEQNKDEDVIMLIMPVRNI